MNKNLALLITTVSFVALMYRQSLALNFALFCILVWVMLFLTLEHRYKTTSFWCLSAATFISALSFAWYGDFHSFVALFFSISFTGFRAFYPGLNIITVPFAAFINYISFIFRVPIVSNWMPGAAWSRGGFMKKLLTYFLVPGLILSLFIWVYSNGSEKFASYFTINWNVDLLQIIGLTLLGFFFMFCYFHFFVPKLLLQYNSRLGDDFSAGYADRAPALKFFDVFAQRRSGEVTMVLLNALLIFFIIIYSIEQFGGSEITGSGTLSSEVHERVYVLIFSILMAILLIMVYFSGLLNFDNKSGLLKGLFILWICLNIILVAVVVGKNIQYVQGYGLTFKRIGVFVFLLLSIAGLLTAYHKLVFKKTNIFLLNRMFWIVFGVLVVTAAINWSGVVTRYNLGHQQKPDLAYLYSLDFNKEILFKSVGDQNPAKPGAEAISARVQKERSKKWLSRNLYYQFIEVK